MFKATVIIKRRQSIFDPQGKATEEGAKLLGFNNVKNTRIGKFIEFNIEGNDRDAVDTEVKEYCEKLLSNPIMEDYEYKLEDIK